MFQETTLGGKAREFPATRWTLVADAGAASQTRREALESLLAIYWKPLYFHARRKGLPVEAAKDAVQGFLVHVLEQDLAGRADPARGRFRHYLRASFDNHLHNQHERDASLKRGGAVQTLPLDFEIAEREIAAAEDPAESALDREWALGVMERALAALRREFEFDARRERFEAAMEFFRPETVPTYQAAAEKCGMTESQFKAFLHRVRVRFRRIVRQEVEQTVSSAEEADSEMADLVRALK